MEGVILFADDHVFHSDRRENELFKKFNFDCKYSVLPIDNLLILEKTVSSVSTYKALILDWNFKQFSEEDDVKIPDSTPFNFLKDNKVYSLIYIYSQADIPLNEKQELESLYPNKIFFTTKEADNSIEEEYQKITEGIERFELENLHLKTPFIWSQTINTSVQNIFKELEIADPNWIKEIYQTANNDGAEPNSEVIGVFQNILNESIIQNDLLLKSIFETSQLEDIPVTNKEESVAKLFHRIYYTKLHADSPIMTGDIFEFSTDEFAILITPECDINKKKETSLEFLKFSKSSSADFITRKKKESDLFNNKVQSRHILPSFPFELNVYNKSAFIDFEISFIIKSKNDFDGRRSNFKLNSPYIFQLRQRYLAYIGRVGVPAIPPSLKSYNLK